MPRAQEFSSKAFLFAGLVSQFSTGRLMDFCSSLVIYGGEEQDCSEAFEEWLLRFNYSGEPLPTKIEAIVGAPLLERLFTETDYLMIDWENIATEAQQNLEGAQGDTGQGYWVDCNKAIPSGTLAASIDFLQQQVSDEIRSDLNWDSGKNYYFLLSVLTPPKPFRFSSDESNAAEEDPALADLTQRLETFPVLARKELAVLILARNSVVASWLWRKYAATTPLASHSIRVDAWCGAMSVQDDA
jgi:hypothetical protein